jgi:hypothetical protein
MAQWRNRARCDLFTEVLHECNGRAGGFERLRPQIFANFSGLGS